MEQWRNIDGYEEYQVSNYGRVKSLKYGKERIIKDRIDKCGYLQVHLYKDGKGISKTVHRLVAQAFIQNPNNLPQVNHKDENKQNNHVDNLEWCSHLYNMNYGTCQKRSHEKLSKRVDQIDPQTREVVHQWESTKECVRNDYKPSNVAACARGVIKQYKGFIWKYHG